MPVAIVAARFNPEVTDRLLQGCLKTLEENGVPGKEIKVVRVPGSYEIPWAANELALSKRFEAVICIGAIMKGQTPQNDYIAQACAISLQEISTRTRIPCIFGIITPRTERQALARTRGKLHRGTEAARAALEVLELKKQLSQQLKTYGKP